MSIFSVEADRVLDEVQIRQQSMQLLRSKAKIAARVKALIKSKDAPNPYGPAKLGVGLLVKNYNPMNRPLKGTGSPDIVSVGIKLLRLVHVSDINHELKVDVLLTVRWKDIRLIGVVPKVDSPQIIDTMQIWTPGVSIARGRVLESPLVYHEGIKLYSDGTIEITRTALYTADVEVDVHYFPFDVQSMEIWFECPDYDGSQVEFVVNKKQSTTTAKDEEIWQLDAWTVMPEVRKSVTGNSNSYVIATAHVRRLFGTTLLMLVAPLYIIANFSFMAFFVYTGDFPTRAGIVSTGFLTLIAFIFVISSNLPKVAYLTWLHSYIGVTMFFIMITLFEVILVHVLDPLNQAGSEQQMTQFQLKQHQQEFEQDLQLARNGAANLDNVFLTDGNFNQHKVVIAAVKAFNRVDVSKNGQIDSQELTVALNEFGIHVNVRRAHQIIAKYSFEGDEDLDAISRAEFITYALDEGKHEKKDALDQRIGSKMCCGFTSHHVASLDWFSKRIIPIAYTLVTICMLITVHNIPAGIQRE